MCSNNNQLGTYYSSNHFGNDRFNFIDHHFQYIFFSFSTTFLSSSSSSISINLFFQRSIPIPIPMPINTMNYVSHNPTIPFLLYWERMLLVNLIVILPVYLSTVIKQQHNLPSLQHHHPVQSLSCLSMEVFKLISMIYFSLFYFLFHFLFNNIFNSSHDLFFHM